MDRSVENTRATVTSFAIGISPFSGMGTLALSAYTSVFFLLVWSLVLFPDRLIDMVGKPITPVLMGLHPTADR